jgi:hypothetical protein
MSTELYTDKLANVFQLIDENDLHDEYTYRTLKICGAALANHPGLARKLLLELSAELDQKLLAETNS